MPRLRSSRNLLIGLGIALLLVVLALSYAIGASVARPVERLRRALTDAAAGNRDFRISHRRKDAFGELFDAFNSLADTVQREEQTRRRAARLARGDADRRSLPDAGTRRSA